MFQWPVHRKLPFLKPKFLSPVIVIVYILFYFWYYVNEGGCVHQCADYYEYFKNYWFSGFIVTGEADS